MLDQEYRVKDFVVDEYQLRASAHYKQDACDRCASVGDVGKVLFGIGIHRAAFLFAGDLDIEQVGRRRGPDQGPDADHRKHQKNKSKI